jgi:hypothetical protein
MRKTAIIYLGVILFILFAPTISFSQVNPNMHGWLAKYWFYRWRLRNDFMVMGEGPGQSLVAESRNENRGQYIKWSDAMIMHGYYLTMLAVEHKILQTKGRYADLKNNERELYYAIKAFERVDYVSETFYSADGNKNDTTTYRPGDNALPPDVNGYFFRDDVPPTFVNQNQWGTWPEIAPDYTLNHQRLTSSKTGIDYGAEIKYNLSAYSSLWDIVDGNDGNSPPKLSKLQQPIVNYKSGEANHSYGFGEESVDQAIRLLLGFFTIVKSIEDVSYGIDLNRDGTDDVWMNFQEEAKRHSTNIIGRFAGHFSGTMDVADSGENNFWLYPSLWIPGGHAFWTIINPRGNEVSEGSTIVNYMPPIQKISKPLFTPNNDLGIGSQNYAAWPSSPVYNSLWGSGIFGYSTGGNVKMTLILNTISNSGSGYLSVGRFIYNKSSNHHYQALYTPLYDYLWNWDPHGQNDQDKKAQAYQYANLMLEAAPCVGPHNFGYTTIAKKDPITETAIVEGPFSSIQDPDGIPYYWNVPFVFDNAHNQWDDGYVTNDTDTIVGEGWFSGVDYMLLYNLVYANNDGDKPLYHDLINRTVDYDINTDDYTDMMVYSGEGLMIGAFENLKVSGNIYGNTPVTLKALDYVELDEGIYDPDSTGSITIEVGKITCGNDFTSSNTPYAIAVNNSCPTCSLENQIGSFVAPVTNGKDRSNVIQMPDMAELEFQAGLNQSDGVSATVEKDVAVFPNPTADFIRITAKEEIRQIRVLDQAGAEVKRFAPSDNLYDIRELASGLYTIILTFNNDETKYIQVIKL